MKSFSLEALTIQLQDLEKKVVESQQQRARQSVSRNYPTIVFPKPEERKAEDAVKGENTETAEGAKADEAESSNENVPDSA
jgi:hypothetical protein